MKITKEQLRQIIKEEIESTLREAEEKSPLELYELYLPVLKSIDDIWDDREDLRRGLNRAALETIERYLKEYYPPNDEPELIAQAAKKVRDLEIAAGKKYEAEYEKNGMQARPQFDRDLAAAPRTAIKNLRGQYLVNDILSAWKEESQGK